MAATGLSPSLIASKSGQKELLLNDYFTELSHLATFAVKMQRSDSLIWLYYGGNHYVSGKRITIPEGFLVLQPNSTNYIERTQAGVLSSNISSWTPGKIPLYRATTSSVGVESYSDDRISVNLDNEMIEIPLTGNHTIDNAESLCEILRFTGTLSSDATVIFPNWTKRYIIHNATSGGYSVLCKLATGTSVSASNNKHCVIAADGNNMLRITPEI